MECPTMDTKKTTFMTITKEPISCKFEIEGKVIE